MTGLLMLASSWALAQSYSLAPPQETDLAPDSTPVTVYNWRESVADVKAPGGVAELPVPHSTPYHSLHLSMHEAILLSLRNNPSVQSAGFDRVIDKFALIVAHNAFEPNFTLGGTASFLSGHRPSYNVTPGATLNTISGTQFAITSSSSFAGGVGPWNSTFTVTQPLLRGAGYDLNSIPWYNALDTENQQRLSYKGTIMGQIVTVISSYRILIQDYQNIEIQRRTLENNQSTVKQAELKYKVGQLSRSDLAQQKVTLETTKLAMLQQKSSWIQDYQNFLSALGLKPEAQVSIDHDIDYTDIQIPSLETCIQLALKGNVDYQKALIAIRATQRAIIQAKDATRWQLNLVGSFALNNNNNNLANPQTVILAQPTQAQTTTTTINPAGPAQVTQTQTVNTSTNQIFPIQSSTGVSVQLNIPINDVKAKSGLVSARVGLEKARLALEQTRLDLVRKITNAVLQINNQKLAVKAAEAQVELQRQNLAAAQLKFRYGRTTAFEVNQIQDQYLSQATSLVAARISLLNQITNLYQELGLTLEKWDIHLRY